MKATIFSIIFSLTIFSQAGAQEQEFICPRTNESIRETLVALAAFRTDLAEKLKCKEVTANLNKITNLLSSEKRQSIMGLITGSETLDAKQADAIKGYVADVTSEVGVAIDLIVSGDWGGLFNASDKCALTREEKLTAVEKLSNVVTGVVGLVSQVAGPYGVPIQIGSQVFQGVLTGLQAYSERSRNIDFDNVETRLFFESAVCTMEKIDSDIKRYSRPDKYLNVLTKRLEEIDNGLKKVAEVCEKCAEILWIADDKDAYTRVKKLPPAEQRLGMLIYEQRAKRNWLQKEIISFRKLVELNSMGSGVGLAEVKEQRKTIMEFLMNVAAPEFLEWYADVANDENSELAWATQLLYRQQISEVREKGKEYNFLLPQSIEEEFSVVNNKGDVYVSPRYGMAKNSYISEAYEVSSLYFVKQNLPQVPLSIRFYSELKNVYDIWDAYDLKINVVEQYCSYFSTRLQYSRDIEDICEDGSYRWDKVKSGYLAFYLADLIQESSIMRSEGPYSFRLEEHKDYIKAYEAGTPMYVLKLAKEGIDLDAVIERNNLVREKFGFKSNENAARNLVEAKSGLELSVEIKKNIEQDMNRIQSALAVSALKEGN